MWQVNESHKYLNQTKEPRTCTESACAETDNLKKYKLTSYRISQWRFPLHSPPRMARAEREFIHNLETVSCDLLVSTAHSNRAKGY